MGIIITANSAQEFYKLNRELLNLIADIGLKALENGEELTEEELKERVEELVSEIISERNLS